MRIIIIFFGLLMSSLLSAQNDIRVENTNRAETVIIQGDVSPTDASGRIILKQNTDQNGLVLDGGEGTGGGQINMFNSAGLNTLQIDAEGLNNAFILGSNTIGNPTFSISAEASPERRAGQFTLRNIDGQTRVALDGAVSETQGSGRIRLFQVDGDLGALIDGGEGAGGGDINLYNSDEVPTVSIDGDNGEFGPFIIMRDGGGNTMMNLQSAGFDFHNRVTIFGSDFSESFNVTSDTDSEKEIEPGTLLSIDENIEGNLIPSTRAYDKNVAGIVSGAGGIKTGMVMGQEGTLASGDTQVAISGRVYVLSDATKQAINPGDLLTSSNTPGYAMKATKRKKILGAVVGKALTSLEKGKTGLVLILVNLQ